MLEKLFKVTFILTIWSLIFVAVAALLPDSVWEKTPATFHPLRNFLAQKKIISSTFLKSNRFDDLSIETGEFEETKGLHCDENGVCTVAWVDEKTDQAGRIPIRKGTGSVDTTPLNSELPNFSAFPSLPALPSPSQASSPSSLPPLPNSPPASFPALPALPTPTSTPAPLPLPALPASSPTLPPLPSISPQPTSNLPTASMHGNLEPIPKNLPVIDTPKEEEGFASSQMERGFSGFQAGVDYPTSTPAPLPEPARNGRDSLSDLSFDSIDSIRREDNVASPGTERMIPSSSFPDTGTISPTSGTTNSPIMPLAQPAPANDLLETIALSQNRAEYRASFIKLNHLLRQTGDSLNQSERGELNRALDRLAYSIFYDPNDHILESHYIVGNGNHETLTTIAAQYKITPELLAAINGISAPGNIPLAPQTRLKVVRGPVTASVSMSKKELTVFFDGLYAGRFRMGYARAAQGLRGIVSVENKIQNPQYHGPLPNGQVGEIAGGSPDNPLGPVWIALNNGLGLQGTNHPEFVGNETAPAGGLIFSNNDIVNLNTLLPIGATINLKE